MSRKGRWSAVTFVLRLVRFTVVLLAVGASLAGIKVVPLPLEPPDIPPGHLPAVGECRIWEPDQPPGQQPAPGRCEELAEEVPQGGWLIYRVSPASIGITAYSTEVEGLAGEVAYYDAKTLEPLEDVPPEISAPSLELPRGQLPPPGQCKVWLPDRPAGQQSPPTSCSRALADLPPGAWLLYRSSSEEIVVTAYHPEAHGVVLRSESFPVEP